MPSVRISSISGACDGFPCRTWQLACRLIRHAVHPDQHYKCVLGIFTSAMGIDLTESRSQARKPCLKLPAWANVEKTESVLAFVNALLLRFSEKVLGRSAPVLLPEASRIQKSIGFQQTRLCQWTYQLDRGSLVCFREIAKVLGQSEQNWASCDEKGMK